MCIWKAWKKVKTKVANLIRCGINRYKSIIEKYQNDSNSVCFDEIQFLGDYYPRKIENVSKELDRLYYGF